MKRGSIYEIIPVELSSFTATVKEDNIQLYWTTATETNNLGFEIEKINPSKSENIYDWEKIGFVPGCGTSTKPKSYSFVDKDITPGKHKYRLKQIDLDGSYEYSDIIEAEVMQKLNYTLKQNYPNPFNPSTLIGYQLPVTSKVTLKVYDILGNEIATLVNEEKPAGNYNVIFDASKLSSGVYFYTLKTGEFSKTNKMILAK
ncbi:MAG: T9SS type A sorting domain-containing protein [Ignavibacteriota bacterium]|nr:T9SS C-terminal target domain-containing protein [Ignavibacteriota bacterium]MCO6447974.1 T9SS type A sorting domain-containing protein [Ignavibacterium album]QKK01007.1 MAG: T9SS type A sorting domain-containing protein [Ignavibacteriota bacterium]